MDPISAAASIAGLYQVVDLLVGRLSTYVKGVQAARKEIEDLSNSVMGLSGILKRLRDLAFEVQQESHGASWTGSMIINETHIITCRTTVKQLQTILEKHDPLREHELLNYNADGVRRLITRQGRISDRVGLLMAQHEERVEIEERQARRENNRRILQFLGESNYESMQSSILATRYRNTGTWFTDGQAFQEWYGGAESKLWLCGIPEAGKTVLTAWVVHYIQLASRKAQSKDGLAFFFCSYQQIDSHMPRTILGAIIRQFAEQSEVCMAELQKFHQDHYPDGRSSLTPSIEGLCQLVRSMSEQFNNARIIIDALDEIEEKKRGDVVELLGKLSNPGNPKPRILLTSRDEFDLRQTLSSFEYQAVNIEAKDTDLRLYVEYELNKRISTGVLELSDPALKDGLFQGLPTEAGGMFRWVVCQLDFLCDLPNDEARRDALTSLPPNLRESYERILDRVENQHARSRNITKTVLRWLVSTRHPISLAALAEAVAVQYSDRILQKNKIPTSHTIIKLCSSFVRTSADYSTIELAHFSVKEFLVGLIEPESASPSKYSTYAIKPEDGELEVAKTLLTYLCFDDFGGECPKDRQAHDEKGQYYPLRSFTVAHWDHYALSNYGDPDLLALAQRFFQPSKSFQLVSWSQDLLLNYCGHKEGDDGDYRDIISWGSDISVLHWACFLAIPSICQWLVLGGLNVNKTSWFFGTPIHCAIAGPQIFGQSGERQPEDGYHSPNKPLRREVVQILVEAKADTDTEMCLRWNMVVATSPLYLALQIGNFEVAQVLLRHGALFSRDCVAFMEELMEGTADCSEFQPLITAISPINIRSEDNMRVLDLAVRSRSSQAGEFHNVAGSHIDISKLQASLRTAARNGMEDLVKELVVKLEGNVDTPEDITEKTALHLAAENGSVECIRTLIRQSADVHSTAAGGLTPLHVAIKAEHPEAVTTLLAAKSNIKAVTELGQTAVHLAADSRKINILELLEPSIRAEQFSMSTPDNRGRTPVLIAAQNQSLSIVDYITRTFPEADLESFDHEGEGCLHLATRIGSLDHIKYFLDRDLDAHRITKDGSTALHLAAASPQHIEEIMEVFLGTQGLNPLKIRQDGATPIHILCQNRSFEARNGLSKLLAYYAPDGTAVNAPWMSHNEYTPLHCLVYESHITISNVYMIDSLCSRMDININAKCKAGCSPWLALIRRLCNENLLDLGPIETVLRAVKLFFMRKDTILDDADLQKSLECLCMIIPTNVGIWTLDLLRILVDRGANINAKNENGDSAFTLLLGQLGKAVYLGEAPMIATEVEDYTTMLSEALDHATENEVLQARFLGHQVLSVALSAKKEDLIRKILERTVEVDQEDDSVDADTPLEVACMMGCGSSVATQLVDKSRNFAELGRTGYCPLHIAAYSGSKEMVAALLSRNVSPNMKSRDGRTPIQLAAQQGHVEIARMLVKGGADVNLTDNTEGNLVHEAAQFGQIEMLKYLLGTCNSQLITGTTSVWFDAMEVSAFTALHLAAIEGRADTVKFLLKSAQFSQIDIRTTGPQYTPLYLAAWMGHASTVANLLDLGADHNLTESISMLTPLHKAAKRGFYPVVRILLDSGADTQKKDKNEATPELLALAEGHTQVAELLRKRDQEKVEESQPDIEADKTKLSNVLLEGLAAAIQRDDFEGCTRLVEYGPDLAAPVPNCEPCTALIYALNWRRFRIARLLIEQGSPVHGVTCAKSDTAGYGPIHYAAAFGDLPTLSLLLEKSQKGLSDYAVTPLHLAAAGGHTECMKALLEYKCSDISGLVDDSLRAVVGGPVGLESQLLPSLNSGNKTAPVTRVLLVKSEVTKIGLGWRWLVGNERICRVMDGVLGTALHAAANYSQDEAVALLLEWKANINSEDTFYETPLALACLQEHISTIELLIKRGANINCRTFNGQTPVMIAAIRGQLNVLHLLKAHGADFTCRDKNGRGALYHAASNGKDLVVKYLFDVSLDPIEKDDFRDTAFLAAVGSGSEVTAGLFLDRYMCIHDRTIRGNNVINIASEFASLATMTIILKSIRKEEKQEMINNSCISSVNSPLYIASVTGRPEIVNLLLDNGATIDIAGGRLGTALMAACAMGRLEVVKLLVKRGAKLECAEDGKALASAYEAARHHKTIQEWLLSYMKQNVPLEADVINTDIQASSSEGETMSTTSSMAQTSSIEGAATSNIPDISALIEEEVTSLVKPSNPGDSHATAPSTAKPWSLSL
ncbi:hypothetical protein MMC17_002871 [Xylographa soralifera]|nr:hypothetical protein [Xylographa soralifera]